MMNLLKDQVVEPRRREPVESRDKAALAVERLRNLNKPMLPPRRKIGVISRGEKRHKGLIGTLAGASGALAIAALILILTGPSASASPGKVATSSQVDQVDPGNAATGSGYVQFTRDKDFSHVVSTGESLSEIAYFYGIDIDKLARYNGITNPDSVRAGQAVTIPSKVHEASMRNAVASKPQAASPKTITGGLTIAVDRQDDGSSITAHFSIQKPDDPQFTSYEWDLGNGRKAFRPNTYWTYDEPGTYNVSLKVRTDKGQTLKSNTIFIDVPHPASYKGANQRFITLGSLQDSFKLDGNIVAVSGYSSPDKSPIVKVGEDGAFGLYQSSEAGFFTINAQNDSGPYNAYLFVSPIKSVHSDRVDMNWYRTQFNTGALSNCGPSSVAMAIAWAKGDYLPVSSVRQTVGWKGDGSTSVEELRQVLVNDGVKTQMRVIRKAQDFFDIIDRGDISIILINTGSIAKSRNPASDLFGRYYSDTVGHYIVVKGYSVDKKYLIVYDPIPSDWSSNSYRYSDGISMMGRNRYYPVDQVISSLRRADVMEISQ